jgi:hypothetical protein
VTARRCETKWFDGTGPCGKDAEGKYRRACPNGHAREGFMCAYHAMPPAAAWCRPCRDEGSGLVGLDIERIGEPA